MAKNTTLAARLTALNAATLAWVAEDPKHRGAGTLIEDTAHWARYGVHTGADLDRYLLKEDIWDLYKSVHGIRPRWINFDAMTMAEMEEMAESLTREGRENYEREAREKREAAHAAMLAANAKAREARAFNRAFNSLGAALAAC